MRLERSHPIDWLVERGAIHRQPAWWDLGYQPTDSTRHSARQGIDDRRVVPLSRLKRKLVHLGTATIWAGTGEEHERDIVVHPGPEIPLTRVPVEIDGRKFHALVTIRPFDQRESGMTLEELREQLKEDGLYPPVPKLRRPMRLDELAELTDAEYFKQHGEHPVIRTMEELSAAIDKTDSLNKSARTATWSMMYFPHVRGIFAGRKGNRLFFHTLNAEGGENETAAEVLRQVSKKLGTTVHAVYSPPLELMHESAADIHAKLAKDGRVQKKLQPIGALEPSHHGRRTEGPTKITVHPIEVHGVGSVPILMAEGTIKGVFAGGMHPTTKWRAPYYSTAYARINDEKLARTIKQGIKRELGMELPVEVSAPGKPRRI